MVKFNKYLVLEIKKVLVSQPEPQILEKSPFASLVEKCKLKLEFFPFIKTVSVPIKEFRKQRIDITNHTAVIFTSKNNVDNYFRICEESRYTVPESMMYFCVSEAIALYLQKYTVYRKRKIFFGKSKFIDMIDLLLKHSTSQFLVPLTEPHKPEIPKLLMEAKLKYDVAVLSTTESVDLKDKIDIDKFDLLLFYSPLEVVSLVENFGDKAKSIKIAAFGMNTGQAAIDAGCDLVALAPTTLCPSMVMSVAKYIADVKRLGDKIDLSYIDECIADADAQNQEVIEKVKNIKPKRAASQRKTCAK